MARDELFPEKSKHRLNVGKIFSELNELMRKKENIENEFLETQHQYDLTNSPETFNKMAEIYIRLEQIEEDIDMLENLAMYTSNTEDRKNLFYGDF